MDIGQWPISMCERVIFIYDTDDYRWHIWPYFFILVFLSCSLMEPRSSHVPPIFNHKIYEKKKTEKSFEAKKKGGKTPNQKEIRFGFSFGESALRFLFRSTIV